MTNMDEGIDYIQLNEILKNLNYVKAESEFENYYYCL